MSNYDSSLAEATQLSVGDRIQLIEALWETVPQGGLPPLTDEWLAEIEKRSAECADGSVTTIPWTEVKANALQQLGAKAE